MPATIAIGNTAAKIDLISPATKPKAKTEAMMIRPSFMLPDILYSEQMLTSLTAIVGFMFDPCHVRGTFDFRFPVASCC